MKVYLGSYHAISMLHGGAHTQLRSTAQYLQHCGVDAQLFDPWMPLRRGDCDLFHLFAANIGTYHLAREVRSLGIPLVVSPIVFSLHGRAFIRASLQGTRLMQRFVKGFWTDYGLVADICGWSDEVLPNTHAEARMLVGALGVPQERVRVVPNGVDERFAYGDAALFRKKYGLDGFILNVGHPGHARKNILSLIQALAHIDHPAVIIGRIVKGEYGEQCVREAARHEHIRLIDGLDHDSDMLASAYAACDVFVLPSLFETPGIAALEAGLAGAKVVVTQHGGTREYFGDLATYVDPASVDSIQRGILRALKAPRSETLRDHIRKHYLWPRIAELTAAAYKEVLAKAQPTGKS